jgi:hypothetical protein
MFYRKTVIGLITRSIAEFSLHVGHKTIPQLLLPDIWVDGKKLYHSSTTLDDGERRRYMLSYDKLLDRYEDVERNVTPLVQHILQNI